MTMDSETMMERARKAAERHAKLPEDIRLELESRWDSIDREAEREQEEREFRSSWIYLIYHLLD